MKDTNDIWDEIEMSGHGERLDEEMFEFISAYADGECTPKERRLVEAYLAENSGARALLADLRAQSAITESDFVEPPEWLRDSILARTTRRKLFGGRLPLIGRLAAAAGATAIAVFLVLPRAEMELRVATNLDAGHSYEVAQPAAEEGSDDLVSGDMALAAIPTEVDVRNERRVWNRVQPNRATTERGFIADNTPPSPPPLGVSRQGDTRPQQPVTEPVVFTGPGYSTASRGEPAPVDTVALTGGRDDSAERTPTPPARPRRSNDEVLPDARERLRERLDRLNAQQDDVKEVINSK